MYHERRILVTGAAGFIGSHFVHLVIKKYPSDYVVSLDKLTYASSIDYLKGLDGNRHQFVRGDITDAELVARVMRDYRINTIVHFAAESHVDRSIQSPLLFVETNVTGTAVLLEEARKYWLSEQKWNEQQCRFHHVSTDEVYGSLSLESPAFTEINPYQPNSPYSASKAASDHLVRAYHHTYGLPVTLSHCSNNYGPHQHHEKLIPTVIRSCLQEQRIPLYGTGLNIRDWLYVEDHVEAIDLIVRQASTGASYHIGGKTEKTNRDVVEMICDWMDEHFPKSCSHRDLITLVDDRAGHDWRYAMNIDKIERELHWYPKTGFAEGLSRTLSYYSKQYALLSTVC